MLADPAWSEQLFDLLTLPIRLRITADPVAVRDALIAMNAPLLAAGMSQTTRDMAQIVLAEVLNNIVEHAYAGQGGTIEISISFVSEQLRFRICDHGAPMPSDSLPLVAEGAETSEPTEGGYGWRLIRALAQALNYRRHAGRNLLLFGVGLKQSADLP